MDSFDSFVGIISLVLTSISLGLAIGLAIIEKKNDR